MPDDFPAVESIIPTKRPRARIMAMRHAQPPGAVVPSRTLVETAAKRIEGDSFVDEKVILTAPSDEAVQTGQLLAEFIRGTPRAVDWLASDVHPDVFMAGLTQAARDLDDFATLVLVTHIPRLRQLATRHIEAAYGSVSAYHVKR